MQTPQTARTNTKVVLASAAFGLPYTHDVTATKQDRTGTPVLGENEEIRYQLGTFQDHSRMIPRCGVMEAADFGDRLADGPGMRDYTVTFSHGQLTTAPYRVDSSTPGKPGQCCTIPGTHCPFQQRHDRMRSGLVILVAVVIAAIAVIFAVSPLVSSPGARVSPAQLPSTPASYLGVYEAGALETYQPFTDFTKAAGQQPNLVGYYSGWGEPFERSFAETVNRHGAITILQWDPTLASVPKIASGGYDSYLRSFAEQRPQVRPPGSHRLRA